MGLVQQLDYAYPSPNALQRTMQRVASSRFGSWLFSKIVHHVDLALLRTSQGRASLPGLTSGLPVITLTTIGAKSGASRTVPLLGIPIGSDLALIGSGWGMHPTPAWVRNLTANPTATVQYQDRVVEVRARQPTPEESDQVWESARTLYPGYAVYPARASHREISVFILELAATS